MTMRETIGRILCCGANGCVREEDCLAFSGHNFQRRSADTDAILAALSTLTDEMVERGAGAMRKVQMNANPYTANYVEESLAMARACLTEAVRAPKGE